MKIQILSVVVKTEPAKVPGKTYQVAEVAYKNLTYGDKVEGKKVLAFGAQADTFKALSVAQPNEVYDVEVVKNQGGFNDWVKITKAVPGAPAQMETGSKAPLPSPKNTYETPEERARKQVYITRMGCLNTAVATLSVGAKKLEPADVMTAAKVYEAYVMGNPAPTNGGATGFDDVPDFDPAFNQPDIK